MRRAEASQPYRTVAIQLFDKACVEFHGGRESSLQAPPKKTWHTMSGDIVLLGATAAACSRSYLWQADSDSLSVAFRS